MSFVGGRQHLRSPGEQANEIEAWAAAQGRRVHMLDPELDAKGSDSTRPIFREAVEGVKSGRFEGIVVAYLSRAGRDLRLMLDLWDEVEAVGGMVYSARENIDGSTAAGRLQRNLLASINQHELEERREGFERSVEAAVERGIWQRRQTPTGYRRDPTTRKLVPDERADEIRQAARDLLAGVPVVEISRQLGMTPNGLRYLLRNRVYLGELTVRSYTNPAAHEPILDPETFAALTVRLTGPARQPRTRPPALLAGLIRCAACGHVMTRSHENYICPTNHSGGVCPEPAAIACGKVEAHVEAIAEGELAAIEVSRAAGDHAAELRQATAKARAELSAYLQAVDAAGLEPEAAEGMSLRREAIDVAERAEQAELSRHPVMPNRGSGASEYRKLAVGERNHVLRSLLSAVVVRKAGKGGNPSVGGRVRVLRYGASLPARRGGRAMGIRPIWPDAASDDVLRLPSGE